MDKTRINEKHPEITPNLRKKEKRQIFGEVSSEGELVLKEAGLSAVPTSIIGNYWGCVLHLDLRNNNLSSIESLPFSKLTQLLTLDLRSNSIDILTESIFELRNLNCLRLDRNLISAIPFDFSTLEQLETLSVSSNKLDFLPNSICELKNLQTLILSENRIKYLPPQLGDLQKLKLLYLHKNQFWELPLSFSELESLRELSLEWFRYTSPPLPRVLKGHIGEAMICSLRALCSKLFNSSHHDCSLCTFLHHFSETTFDFSQMDSKQRSLIHVAASEGDTGVLLGMIEAGVDIDVQDKDGCSPLLLAIKEQHLGCAEALLEAGADINEGGGALGSPLHLSAFKVLPSFTKKLLSMDADPNSRDCEGNTPLHIVLGVFNKDVIASTVIAESLLKAGAEVNALNNEGWAPIHLAARRGQVEGVRWVVYKNHLLRKAGLEEFNLDLQGGSHGWTSIHLAGHASHFTVVQSLVEAGASLMIKNTDGRTPRHASKADLALFKYLIRAEKNALKQKVYQPWVPFEFPTEQSVSPSVEEILDPSTMASRRYQGIYHLASKGNYELLENLVYKLEPGSLKEDASYLLSQMSPHHLTPAKRFISV